MIVPVNAHYHVTAHCVQMKDSAFASDQLIIPVNLQGKIRVILLMELLSYKSLDSTFINSKLS